MIHAYLFIIMFINAQESLLSVQQICQFNNIFFDQSFSFCYTLTIAILKFLCCAYQSISILSSINLVITERFSSNCAQIFTSIRQCAKGHILRSNNSLKVFTVLMGLYELHSTIILVFLVRGSPKPQLSGNVEIVWGTVLGKMKVLTVISFIRFRVFIVIYMFSNFWLSTYVE